MSEINILEVGPRDGLQNESLTFSLKDKQEFVLKLASAGLKRIEIGSFVSVQAVPQMAETGSLVEHTLSLQKAGVIPKDVQFSALVPNRHGLIEAVNRGLQEVAVFAGCSDSFSRKNINCSIEESFNIYVKVCEEALSKGLRVRGYLSVAFGCPFEGIVPEDRVVELIRKMKNMGVYEISLSDTMGMAHPAQVESLLTAVSKNISLKEIALHFHDGQGLAFCNVWAAWKMGVTAFDGSVGGLGGCPYSPISVGNIPTEGILRLLGRQSEEKRINKLTDIISWLEKKVGRPLSHRSTTSFSPAALKSLPFSVASSNSSKKGM
ncbi:MAG: hydroxymethylglutaryl-CoA lyase [Bdellovibrionales bacterium]|nr:hydroxymethylglutaryl-CoA lyase [Bdellovibrionales bacterium]